MALIYFVSAQEPNDALDFLGDTGLDKAAHAAEFAVLAFLLVRAFALSGARAGSLAAMLAAGAIAALYAAFDEWHQASVPGRIPDWFDLVADIAGVVLVLIIWKIFGPKRPGLFLLGRKDEDTADQRRRD